MNERRTAPLDATTRDTPPKQGRDQPRPRDQHPHGNADAHIREVIEHPEAILNPRRAHSDLREGDAFEDFLRRRGLELIPLRDLTTNVTSEHDFQKITLPTLERALCRYRDEMLPAMQRGKGLTRAHWALRDLHDGLRDDDSYARTFSALFDTFGGVIHVAGRDANCEIINGNHRVWVAQRLGIAALPAVREDQS